MVADVDGVVDGDAEAVGDDRDLLPLVIPMPIFLLPFSLPFALPFPPRILLPLAPFAAAPLLEPFKAPFVFPFPLLRGSRNVFNPRCGSVASRKTN